MCTFVFFFKQKTAYDMRISDWSSDVCSSDLRVKFEEIKKALEKRMSKNQGLQRLRRNIRFTETREGLRIELVDEADFSMFALATDKLLPQARDLIAEVAGVIQTMPNDVIVRGQDRKSTRLNSSH